MKNAARLINNPETPEEHKMAEFMRYALKYFQEHKFPREFALVTLLNLSVSVAVGSDISKKTMSELLREILKQYENAVDLVEKAGENEEQSD